MALICALCDIDFKFVSDLSLNWDTGGAKLSAPLDPTTCQPSRLLHFGHAAASVRLALGFLSGVS